jgi:hypothetical protein
MSSLIHTQIGIMIDFIKTGMLERKYTIIQHK